MKFGLCLFAVVLLNLYLVTYAQQECPIAPANPQDRRTNTSVLRIASYNAEWLFLNRSNCPGDGCPWRDEAEAIKHMQDVAAEIAVINADILNLVEVQDCSVLHKLNSYLKGMNYVPYLLTGTDTATGQNVALLTRVDPSVDLERTSNRVSYPIPGSQCGSTSKGTSAVSKHYYTTFVVDGLANPLTIFGLHLLAFPDDKARCVQREAQASVIQPLVASYINQGHSVVVMGDMNDFDGSVPDASNNMPISEVLSILRNPLTAPGDEMTNVATFVSQQSQRYSYWYDEDSSCSVGKAELSMIDHLLISNDLTTSVNTAFMDHSYAPACAGYESDHWPVVLHLEF